MLKIMNYIIVSFLLSFVSLFLFAEESKPIPALVSAPDYNNSDTWLCLPGRSDHCDVNLDATEVAADGKLKLLPFEGVAENPAVDCFYVQL